jgi:ATP-binding cassette subfamily B protein
MRPLSPIKSLVRLCYEALSPYRALALLALAFAVAMSTEKAILPYALKYVVDALGDPKDPAVLSNVWRQITIVISVLVASELTYRVGSFVMAHIYPNFQRNVRDRIYSYTLMHDMRFFLQNPIGDISSKIYDLPIYCQRLMQMMIEVFVPLAICAVASITLVFLVSKTLCFAYCIWGVLHFSIAIYTNSRCTKLTMRHTAALNKLQGSIVDSLYNIMHIKVLDNYRLEQEAFDQHQKPELRAKRKALFCLEYVKLSLFFLTVAGFIAVMVIATQQWQQELISVGDLVFVFQINITFMMTLWWFVIDFSFLVQTLGVCLQAMQIMHAPNAPNDAGYELQVTNHSISFCNIDFSYDKNGLFHNLNLEIADREKIALVGFVGSGKTTLTNLLLKNYHPQRGSVRIGGHDISGVTLKSLHQKTTVVPQSSTLFCRSILDNIRYGNPEASRVDVERAARWAHCENFITALPGGYETIIGGDTPLSTGQRQQILIARAILRDTPIVILDEATSALDNITEARVIEGMRSLFENRTVLVIAHRLSTIKLVDRVVLMDNGKIVDQGTHEQLMIGSELYRALWHVDIA